MTSLRNPDLDGALDDLAGIHPGIDLIRFGIRLLAQKSADQANPLTLDQTQTLIAALAGSAGADVITAIGLLAAHLSSPDTNSALLDLPDNARKETQLAGEQALYRLDDPYNHQPAADAAAAIENN